MLRCPLSGVQLQQILCTIQRAAGMHVHNLRCLAPCGQVDILIVNCSLFNPTPSLSAMIVNHFKMASNVVTYNLNGMGCSAGVISISLARELLQVRSPARDSCFRDRV